MSKPTQFPKFADQYIVNNDSGGLTLTDEGRKMVEYAIELTRDIDYYAENPLIDFNFFGMPIKVDYPFVHSAQKFIDDMAYAVASRTGEDAPGFASIDSFMSALKGQSEKEWLAEGNTVTRGENIKVTKGDTPTFDLLHAYLYQHGRHRKALRSSMYAPSSWTKGAGEGWKSLVRTPGIDHGVYFASPKGTSVHEQTINTPKNFKFYQTADKANQANFYWKTKNEEFATNMFFDEFTFADENGVYTKKDWNEVKNLSSIVQNEKDFNSILATHDKVYETLYNVTQSGLPQVLTGQTDDHPYAIGGNIDTDAFTILGLAGFKIDANLAHFTKAIGYDQDQDAYYFSTTDIWDFGSNHSSLWGGGNSYNDVRDQDRYFLTTIGGEQFVFDLLDTNQNLKEMNKVHDLFGDAVVQDTNSKIEMQKEHLLYQNKDQWQAEMMDATGNPIHLYDRIYIPKQIMNDWLEFYGIEDSAPSQKQKWIKRHNKLEELKKHRHWNKLPYEKKRKAIEKYSFYENDPLLNNTNLSHLNLYGIAPELFGNSKSRYVELEGDGLWQNRRNKYLYDKNKKKLVYYDNTALIDGKLEKGDQYNSLWDLHNEAKIGE
tara:strand:+ start:331 stop:2133 length:1803 start_codon:yes stop_codon:yes gene_type:complete